MYHMWLSPRELHSSIFTFMSPTRLDDIATQQRRLSTTIELLDGLHRKHTSRPNDESSFISAKDLWTTYSIASKKKEYHRCLILCILHVRSELESDQSRQPQELQRGQGSMQCAFRTCRRHPSLTSSARPCHCRTLPPSFLAKCA
jgi:hypothetical protein